MCAHFTLFTQDEMRELENIVHIVEKKIRGELDREIYPGRLAPILVPEAGDVRVQPMIWGYPEPRTKKDGTPGAIEFRRNTRIETAEDSPFWGDSMRHRRCFIPAAGFFEKKGGQEYGFYVPGSMLYIAGIYEERKGKPYFSMMTTEPNDAVKPIHNRMPVVMRPEERGLWISDRYMQLANRKGLHLSIQSAV